MTNIEKTLKEAIYTEQQFHHTMVPKTSELCFLQISVFKMYKAQCNKVVIGLDVFVKHKNLLLERDLKSYLQYKFPNLRIDELKPSSNTSGWHNLKLYYPARGKIIIILQRLNNLYNLIEELNRIGKKYQKCIKKWS